MNPRKAKRAALKALHALYDELPELHCQGLCQASCHLTTDLVAPVEMERLPGLELLHDAAARIGNDLSPCGDCPLLSWTNSCTQYELRPLICRLYGLVADPLMICPHGCEPARYLSNEDARRLWSKLVEINRRYGSDCKPQAEIHGA